MAFFFAVTEKEHHILEMVSGPLFGDTLAGALAGFVVAILGLVALASVVVFAVKFFKKSVGSL